MKKRSQNDIIVILISLIVSLFISWYILDSLILAVAFSILVVIGCLHILKRSKEDSLKYTRIDQTYNFINLMNVQMLSTSSVYEAYKSIENYVSNDFINLDIEDLHTALLDIANEYELNGFKMYINTLIIYDTEGGNYKEMQSIPTSLCQKSKIYYNKLKKNKTFKLIEMSSLYLLWICVCFFIKYSVSDFYALMMENILYQIIIFIILLIGTFFYYLAFMEYYNNHIRGM